MLRKLFLIFGLLFTGALLWGSSLGRGIGNPSLTWTTGGDPSQPGENVNWSFCTDDDCDGQPCVTSGAGGAGVASSWLKTTVTGPCKISFRYKVQTYRGRFTVECDSRTLYRFSDVTGTNAEWQNAEYEIPAGEHTITFTYVHPGMGYANRFNGVRLSGFKVTPAEAPAAEKNDDGGDPLGRGIGNPSLTWTTGGDPSQPGENVNWSFCTDDDCDGQPCVTSGAGGAGVASSWLKTTVTGPCKISFRYKVQTYRGRFTVRCDFRTLSRFSDVTGTNAEWKYAEYEIPPGRHTITFTYRHPGMGYANRFNGVRISGFKVTRE